MWNASDARRAHRRAAAPPRCLIHTLRVIASVLCLPLHPYSAYCALPPMPTDYFDKLEKGPRVALVLRGKQTEV